MQCYFNDNKRLVFGVNNGNCYGTAAVCVSVDGDDNPLAIQMDAAEKQNGKFCVSYSDEFKSLSVTSEIEQFKNVLRQKVYISSNGKHTLTQAAGAVDGICFDEDGIKERLCDGSILVHYCVSRWQGEGQWRKVTPEDLGVYPATSHGWERAWYRFDSVSSWSTATYYPLLIIEDKKKNECWFIEAECGHSWFFEIYAYGGNNVKSLSVKVGGADERLGFAKKMDSGDKYETCFAVYGVVQGGFEEAVRALTEYKRSTSLVQESCPLTFNDYMNCNWTNESDKTLIPLIDKAAELGAEIFCLDDGWQKVQGIWYPADEKFGEKRLQGIFDYIKSKGMKIGVWFEFETVPLRVASMIGADDCHLFRNNSIIAPNRPLANMRSKKLIDYLNERVDALYAMGVRFIKNDHNNTEYLGSTIYGESAGEGLENNDKAFLAFIDGILKRYPDMIIENCASGAMRSDNGTLKHFHIQSTSDQENYLAYPSILTGSLAVMPPEKAGIWCYPYPLLFDDREKSALTEKQVNSFKDGEQTIFNVVNGFMGNMYLSGKINQADESNFALLKEGVSLYKQYRLFIRNSFPIFPNGMIRLSERTYHTVGLINEQGTKILLAVWNLSDKNQEVTIDLSKYVMDDCSLIYPSGKEGCSYRFDNGKIICKFDFGRTARLFELTKRTISG